MELHNCDESASPEIVDAFLAFNEFELANFRIEWMSELGVSEIFIGEASTTFSGLPKPLYFSQRLDDLHKLNRHVTVVELFPPTGISESTRWDLEEHYRNQLMAEVRSRRSNAMMIFTDIDEFPSREQIENALKKPDVTHSLPMTFSYRRANWILRKTTWNKAKILGRRYEKANVRYELGHPNIEGSYGQHVSYLSSNPDQLATKYRAFSHSELDKPEFSKPVFIEFCDEFGISHTGNAWTPGLGILDQVPPDKLTELQHRLRKFNPQWFNFETHWNSKIREQASVMATWFLKEKISSTDLTSSPRLRKACLIVLASIEILRIKLSFLVLQIRPYLRDLIKSSKWIKIPQE